MKRQAMTLDGALASAASGLDSITKRLALISQNVANAGTPDYVRQSVAVTSAAAGDQAFGVRTGVATRAMDEHLQGDLLSAVASETGEQVTHRPWRGSTRRRGCREAGKICRACSASCGTRSRKWRPILLTARSSAKW